MVITRKTGDLPEIQALLEQALPFRLCQPSVQQFRKTPEALQHVAAHGRFLSGQFHQRIKQKAAAVKDIGSQVIFQAVFDDPIQPLHGVGKASHSFKNDVLPNAHALVITCIPDLLLVAEVAIEPALGETGGPGDVIDRGVEIAFDREKLHRFFDDFLTSYATLGGHFDPITIYRSFGMFLAVNDVLVKSFLLNKTPPSVPGRIGPGNDPEPRLLNFHVDGALRLALPSCGKIQALGREQRSTGGIF